ncbi:MAG: hypothetical protein WA151_13960 [Desulfatirhabdiaceae bacterium]
MIKLLSILIIASLTGCASVTPTAFREAATAAGNLTTFTMQENYQSVHKRLSEKLRSDYDNYSLLFLEKIYDIRAELYSEFGTSEISLFMPRMKRPTLVIDLKKNGHKTDVTIWWEHWESAARKIKDWLLESQVPDIPQATTALPQSAYHGPQI